MSHSENRDLWSRVDYDLVKSEESVTPAEDESPRSRLVRRFWFSTLDVLSTAFWVYAVLKVFVANVDQTTFGSLAQYRFFFFVGVAALIALKVRNVWSVVGIYAYIVGFPLVVLCWKLPRALYKSGSGVVFLACANLVVAAFTSLRRSVIEFALFAFATLAVVLGRSTAVAGVASVCLALILFDGLYRTIRNSVLPARFVRTQRATLRKVVRSQVLGIMMRPKETLLSPRIERFDQVQQREFARGLWSAVLINRVVALWAAELEHYRRSRITVFLNSATYLWLLIRSLALLTLVNWGVYHAENSAFAYKTAPGFLVMLHYTSAHLYGGQIGGVGPANTVAHAASIVTLAVGVALVIGLIVAVVVSVRATRRESESEIEGLVAGVHAESERIDRNFHSEYGVSPNEAIERLERLKEDTLGLLAGLALRIPAAADPASQER